MSIGKAFQIDYSVVASARGFQEAKNTIYGPWLTIVSHANTDEGSQFPAQSISIVGSAELKNLRDAIDFALTTKDE